MKKIIFSVIFLTINFVVYSQSWTIQGGASNDTEFTVITAEEFQRNIKAHDTVSKAVTLDYYEYSVFMNGIKSVKTIKGTIPTFNGYFYFSARMIPKNETGKFYSQVTSAMLFYGNTRTNSIMAVRFYNVEGFTNTLSLRYDWDEYVRQYNQLLRLINGE